MRVYVVGEDAVTKAVLKRILDFSSKKIEIISELPARGGQINSKLAEFDKLSYVHPVLLLTDLDTYSCAPELLQRQFTQESYPKGKNNHFIFNVAIDEAEAWLMADRKGFADYFSIDITDISDAEPMKQGDNKALVEMKFPCKSSYYLMSQLIQKSRNADYKKQLTPKNRAKKGPEYNACILPFIQNKWNINAAKKNSDSLNRMIKRISGLQ